MGHRDRLCFERRTLGYSEREGRPASTEYPAVTADPCKDTFANPTWKRLSSTTGDLPVPETSDQQTGGVVGDIDGDGRHRRDGVIEVIGGGRWYKHDGGMKFTAHLIDDTQKFSRCAAGKLIKGSQGTQVVFCNGDGCGPLKWYEQGSNGTWTGDDLIGEDLVHGHSLRVGDVDGDGNLDIFCAEMSKWADWTKTVDYPRSHIRVFFGDGKGHFERITVFKGGYGTHEAQLADFLAAVASTL